MLRALAFNPSHDALIVQLGLRLLRGGPQRLAKNLADETFCQLRPALCFGLGLRRWWRRVVHERWVCVSEAADIGQRDRLIEAPIVGWRMRIWSVPAR